MAGDEGMGKLLGLDIGSASVGWMMLGFEDEKITGIIDKGVRVFDPGMENIELDGKGESRNLKRRGARLVRRILERRTRRIGRLAHVLQIGGLLPEGGLLAGQERNDFFNTLDKEIDPPYQLRARALDERMEPFELGRAIYHLGQRRGFLSNRKAAPKKGDDEGAVKKGIGELRNKMEDNGARTLGEYFAGLNPEEERIRQRYTERAMYEQEFKLIWESQKQHHPDLLTDELYKKVHRAIFHQRPLKSQKHLVGFCELEPDRKRAPWAVLSAQRFRYMQRLNDLEIIFKDTGEVKQLTPEEMSTLIDAFESEGDLTFARIRTLLGLKARTMEFNLEKGGEKKLPGNRTASALAPVFGDKWADMPDAERDAVVTEMRAIVKDETLVRRAMKLWSLSEDKARELAGIRLEDGHCNFSRKATERLMPKLRDGVRLQAAVRELYPERWERDVEPKDIIPPVRSDEFGELRNPIVERALTEVRKVVNAVIRKHGKPGAIRIEMARELRQPASERERSSKRMRDNEKKRKAAETKLLKEAGLTRPSRSDIEKVLLAEECGWHCPYTGRQITVPALVGDSPQYDIEHIIPFDRSLDNSYVNKTLCYHDENRHVKGGRTPFEVYHGTEKWGDIIGRVKSFQGGLRDEKLKRFEMDEDAVNEYLESFSSRQLNDTRYATVRAKEFLGLLYGGLDADGIDKDGTRRVQAVTAGVTVHLRNALGLNSILSDGPGKSRDDHRHHAVDALVTALAGPSAVKSLSEAAKRARGKKGVRLLDRVDPPWDGFMDDARKAIGEIVVSHRVDRRVRGALHEETFYGRPRQDDRGKSYVHVRKPLAGISAKDVDDIVDPAVRERVSAMLAELGEADPKKAFKSGGSLPYMQAGDGRNIRIGRVRLKKYIQTFPVGDGHRARNVVSDSNHHMEIFRDKKTGKWDGYVVSLHEAYQRLKRKEPVVRQDFGQDKEFVFSLACGEIIEIDNQDGTRGFFRVRSIYTMNQGGRLYRGIKYVKCSDARKKDEIIKDKAFYSSLVDPIRKLNCRKVVVTPLGDVRYAND